MSETSVHNDIQSINEEESSPVRIVGRANQFDFTL